MTEKTRILPEWFPDRKPLYFSPLGMRAFFPGPTHQREIKTMIIAGRYRHYKGKDYLVLGSARHTETEEEFIVYRALYGEHGLWVRPKAMFLDHVIIDGKQVPRFTFLGIDSASSTDSDT